MKLLPQSEEAEKALLSCWLADPIGVPGQCAAAGVSAEWFVTGFCVPLHAALQKLWVSGKGCDYATVATIMRSEKTWHAGSPQQFSEIADFAPLASNAPQYIETLRDMATLRAVIATCRKTEAMAWEARESAEVVALGMLGMGSAAQLGLTRRTKTFREHIDEYRRDISTPQLFDETLPTGISRLDRQSPIRRGDMVIIAGSTKAGKSILSLTAALEMAKTYPVLYFSLEDKMSRLMKRIASHASKVAAKSHRDPDVWQQTQLRAGLTRLETLNLIPHDDAFDLAAIIGIARRTKMERPDLAAIFVDYGQLIRGTRIKGDSRETEVAATSRALRLLGMEMDVAMIVLSQLNKEGGTRESAALEQDCTAKWKLGLIEDEPAFRHLEIPFQRDGDSGIGFRVAFRGALATVENANS